MSTNPSILLKKTYRTSCWLLYNILTRWHARRIDYIRTDELIYGFKGDFSPFSTFKFKKSGNWDREITLLKDHIVFKSMWDRFVLGKKWEETPHYKKELEKLKAGTCSLSSREELDSMFGEWDILFESIKKHGFKSNRELYKSGLMDNILWLLDEVTVNITRDGKIILNSGWHRAIAAKILGVPEIPVRILVKHALWKKDEGT